jgi:hypothetical protein
VFSLVDEAVAIGVHHAKELLGTFGQFVDGDLSITVDVHFLKRAWTAIAALPATTTRSSAA